MTEAPAPVAQNEADPNLASGRVEDLIRLYEARSREVPNPDEAGHLLARAGDLVRARLKNPDRAEVLFRRALVYAPQSVEALEGLRQLFTQRADTASLAEILEKLAQASAGPAAAALLMQAGELHQTRLDRRDKAVLCFQLATRKAPQERLAYQKARELLLTDAHFVQAWELLERERAALGDRELLPAYLALAEALLYWPQQHALARQALERARAIDPDNAQAKAVAVSLDGLATTFPEQIKRIRQDSVQERDRRKAARLSLQVARLTAYYEPSAVDRVREALDRCLALWPAMPEALDLLEQSAEKAGDISLAVKVFQRLAQDTRDKSAQADLQQRIGQTLLSRLNKPEEASVALEQASVLDPTRPDVAALASELLIAAGKPQQAIACLERHVLTLRDRTAQATLRQTIADHYRRLLKDDRSARAHLEATLKLSPDNAQVAWALAGIHAAAGDLEQVWGVLDLAASAPVKVSERVALCEKVAALAEAKGDQRRAFDALAHALPLEPSKPGFLESLSQRAQSAGLQGEYAIALRRAAQSSVNDDQILLWRALAQLLQTVGRAAEALEAWFEVQRRRLEDPEAVAAIAVIKKSLASEVLDPRSKLEAEAKRLEASAADPEAAAAVYRKILELDPHSAATLRKLGLAAASLGQWEEVAVVAERLLALAESQAERQEWRSRLAQLYAERLNRRDEAARTYLSLLAEGVETASVTGGLERLASQGVRQAEISRALAPVYARGGDYQRQVASLLVQLGSAQDKAEQKALLLLLAETCEKRLLDERAAYDFCLRGLSLDPADSTFRAEASRLAQALEVRPELSRFLVELSARLEDPQAAVLMLDQASELAEAGESVDDAALAIRAALTRVPDDLEQLERLSQVYLRAKRWAEGDQVLRRRVALHEGAEKLKCLMELAQVNAELVRPMEAAAALTEAVTLGAPEIEALPQLAKLHEAAGQLRELSAVQARLIELHRQRGENEKADLLEHQRARLMATGLGDTAEAIRRYAEILAAKPSDAEALGALEELLPNGDHRLAAARALVPVLVATQEHRKLVAALGVVAEAAKDTLERLTALKQAAVVHTRHLRQPELAFVCLANAVRLAPADAEVRDLCRAAAADADSFDSYAEVLTELLATELGPAVGPVLRELAEVLEKNLNDQQQAVERLHQLLKVEPKAGDALKGLQRLHRSREEWFELVPALERLAALENDLGQRTALELEAATLSEQRLGDPERAAANYRQIASRDAQAREAALALDRLYVSLDRPQDLAFALELRRGQEGQSPQGRDVAFRLAQLRQVRLGDPRGALELYRQILAEDGGHEGSRMALETWARSGSAEASSAMEILDPVLARSGDHQRRLALRETMLAAATLPSERARLATEMRAILERDLGQPQAAFLSALKAFTDGGDRAAGQADLERLARETGNFEELAEVYESTADELPEPAEQLGLLRRAAELREQLNENEEAIRLWNTVLEISPQDKQALDSLSGLYEKSKNAKNLSQVYARKAALAKDPAERLGLLMRAAEAFEAAGDDEPAIEALKGALAISRTKEVLTALDRLFAKAHRGPEHADVLAQLSELVEDPTEKAGLLLRRGVLLEKEGQAPEALQAWAGALAVSRADAQAVAGLERLLLIDAVRLEAARVLERVFREQSDLKKLVEVLDIRLEATDPTRRVPLLLEIATLREAVGQKSLALTARVRAFAEAPGDVEVRDELERLAADMGAFEELAACYEDALEKGAGEPLAEELWRRLANVYGERLARADLAVRALTEVLARSPKDTRVLDALAALHRKASNFRELALVMRRQLSLETNLEAQVNLLFELASLAEEMLSDKLLASQCYQAVLERSPEDPNAIKFLARLLAETERYPELATLLQREAELADGKGREEEALELLVRLGRLKLGRLGDPRGALSTFQEVLRRKPAHAGALGALEEMARSDNPLKGEAASTLEPVFENQGEHLKLVQMLEARVGAEPQPVERATLLRKISELYGKDMGNAEMAFVTAARALKELPDDAANLELVLTAYQAADATDEVVALLAEVAPKASSDAARGNLFRALARLQAHNDEPEDAVESYKRVLELSPTDAEAMEAVGRLLAQQGRVPELLEVLKRQLNIEEDTERRAALLFQIGALQDDQLDDPAGALATFRKLLELKPDDPQSLARMDRLCEAQQRWPELADVIVRRLKLATPEERPEHLYRLALVRETRLLDKAGSLDLYAELLAGNPRHTGAISRMESITQREPQNQPAVDVLLKAYKEANEHGKLGQLIEARVSVSQDAHERKTLLVDLGALREAQGEPELTYLALYRAFREDPNDAELRKRLEAAADAAHTWDELASTYEGELARITDSADAALVCLKLGQLQEQKLGDNERAVEFFEKARKYDDAASPKALPALDRLYGQLNLPAQQVDVLEVMAAAAQDPADKVAFNFRAGQLAMERLDNPDRAAVSFEQVLAVDPRHLPSLRSLEQLYEHAKMDEKLYRVLEAQRDLVQATERERVMGRMADVSARGGIGDLDHSIGLYKELLAKNPRSEQAFDSLSKLLDKANRAEELRDLLKGKLQVTIDPRELVRLNEWMGRVLADRLDQPEDAIAHFKAALERDARHRGALESLRGLFEKLGRGDDLVIVLRRLIPLQEDAGGVKQLRIRLAEVLAQSNRREETLDAARRALEVEPHAVADLDRVLAVFSALKAWADAVRTLELKSQVFLAVEDRAEAAKAQFQIADIWREQAGKAENAGPALEKVLEIDPANRPAYEQALALYAQVNDWRMHAQVMDRFLPHLVTDEEKLASLRELAKVQEGRLGQKSTAFLTWCRALHLNPSQDDIREQIERLAEETGGFDELAAVYEEVADELPRGPLAERMYLTLARVQDQKLDDADAAEASLRKILEFDPTNDSALERLAGMFSRRGRSKEYIVSLEQKLEASPSIEKRKEILREISRVYDEQLSNQEEAQSALQRALELEPDQETLGVLAGMQRRQGNHAAVASTLLRMRDIAGTPEERAKFQVEVAQVYERDLGDEEAAVEGFRQSLEFDPHCTPALDALERLYSKLDRPAELLSVYERQLELTQDYRERVKILFKSASIWEERYQNLVNADACIDAALQVDSNNIQAIKTLERLRKAQGRWDELIGVVDRHIQLLTSPEEKAELLVEMGDIFHQQLKAVDRAVTTYHQALELNPRCRPAMHALGTLYERSGNWPFALDMLDREARVAGATAEAVELFFRQGKINEDMLIDPSSAKRCYLDALRIDAGYLPAIRALKGVYELEKDWDNYEKALVEEARQTEDPEAKARAWVDVARFYDSKENRDQATGAYEEALRLIPDMLDAARPLADIYLSKENWDGCEKMLDIVTNGQSLQFSQTPDDEELSRELCRRYYRLGYVCEKLQKRDKALAAYEKAYQLDATYLAVLEGYGNLLVQVQRFEEAQRVYQAILVHHRGDLTDVEVAEIYWTMGDLNMQLKQVERAENHFEKALQIDPSHEPSLRSMVQIAETSGNFERAADFMQKLLAVLDGDAKYEVGVALGKLAREQVKDSYVAIDAYLAAHRIKPDVLDVMDALYVLYRETKQGAKAAEMLEKMLGQDQLRQDPQRAKRVWFALGEINRDELQDLDRAGDCFNAALDLDWRFIESFSALEAMLGRAKRWKTLDDNYKRMIARCPKTEETHQVRMTLWKALGDLYLNVLQAPEAAVEVYKVVAQGMPDNVDIQEQYAALAQGQPGQEQAAVDAWRKALPASNRPGKVASALAELAAKRKDYDSAWLAAQVVTSLLGEAGPGEKEIVAKLTPYAKKREVAQRAMTDRLWQMHLFHPRVRGPMAELMSILFEQAGSLLKEDFSRYGVNPRKHQIDVAGSQEYHIHHYRYVARILGMEQVPLFSPFLAVTRERMAKKTTEPAPEPMVNVEVMHTEPVAIKVGGKYFGESGQKEVYYALGRTLALLRPELALTTRVSAERLEALMQAAISLSVDRFRFTADLRAIDTERRGLEKHLTESARNALARVTKEYVKVATPNDLRNYLEGAELSAVRAGAFVAGDIEPVKRMVMAETGSAYRVKPATKIRELMVFALGEDLHALRLAVGTNVEVQVRK